MAQNTHRLLGPMSSVVIPSRFACLYLCLSFRMLHDHLHINPDGAEKSKLRTPRQGKERWKYNEHFIAFRVLNRPEQMRVHNVVLCVLKEGFLSKQQLSDQASDRRRGQMRKLQNNNNNSNNNNNLSNLSSFTLYEANYRLTTCLSRYSLFLFYL
jgi:hypothetical protein